MRSRERRLAQQAAVEAAKVRGCARASLAVGDAWGEGLLADIPELPRVVSRDCARLARVVVLIAKLSNQRSIISFGAYR